MPNIETITLIIGAVASIGIIIGMLINGAMKLWPWKFVNLHLISVTQYYELWDEWEANKEKKKYPGPHDLLYIIAGDCKRCFEVLEFRVKNASSENINVGPFVINDWIHSDKYTQAMYDRKRDYRVFDRRTKELIGLDRIITIPPHDSYNFRVEIYEEAYGPETRSFHNPHSVDRTSKFEVKYAVDDLAKTRVFKIKKKNQNRINEYTFHTFVYRWSDLLGPLEIGPEGAPPPQSNIERNSCSQLQNLKTQLKYKVLKLKRVFKHGNRHRTEGRRIRGIDPQERHPRDTPK